MPDWTAVTRYSPGTGTSLNPLTTPEMGQSGRTLGQKGKGGIPGIKLSTPRHPLWVGRGPPPPGSPTLSFARLVWGIGIEGTFLRTIMPAY